MPRAHSTFRQTDVTKAIKGVQAANCSVVRVLIGKGGDIEITAKPASAKAGAADDSGKYDDHNEWDSVK